ncbi:MAG: SapC family protein [Georgfuchsia sp.]
MPELLFYRQITALDKDKHRQLRVGEIRKYNFTRQTNSVPLTAVEFFEAAREYPIVFAQTNAAEHVPIALLGLRDKENLFVDRNGRWDARYIPAFVRRYPFVPAEGGKQLLVCIDEGHPAVGASDGQLLFASNGSPTPFLDKAITFLRDYQAEAMRTKDFVKRLTELDLFTGVAARAELRGGNAFQLGGLSVISETKYRAIDKETVEELFRKGWLALIDAHLLSLGNLGRLIDRIASSKA